MRESNEDHVTLTAVSSAGVLLVLDFVYGGSLTLTKGNIEDVLAVASYLQIHSALECCCEFIRETLSLENCVKYSKLAYNFALDTVDSEDIFQDSIIECLDRFILGKISDLHLMNEHIKITQFETMRKLVSSDKIQMAELTLYNVVVDWLLADPSRMEYCDELMKHIRFMLIPLTDLERLQAHPDCDTEVVKDKIEKALKYVSVPVAKKIQWESPVDAVRGRPNITIVMSNVFRLDKDPRSNEASRNFNVLLENDDDLSEEFWVRMPQLPEYICLSSGASLGNFLFICGGTDGESLTPAYRECHVFDPVTWQWDKIAPMNVGRHSFTLVAHEKELYAIGGRTQNAACIDSIEKYSVQDNCWQVVARYPVPAAFVAAVSAAGLIYMYGGEMDDGQEVRSFHSFDPHNCEWKSLPLSLGDDIQYKSCTLIFLENHVCVFSCGRRTNMLCFNISTQQWVTFPSPFSPQAQYDLDVYLTDGHSIYCLGRTWDNQRCVPDFQRKVYRRVKYYPEPDFLYYAKSAAMGVLLSIPNDRLEKAKLKALRDPNFKYTWATLKKLTMITHN